MQGGISSARGGAEQWFAGPGPANQPSATRIFNIRDLIAVLGRSRRLIALTVAATTVTALGVGILLPKNFAASTQLFVDSRSLKILANDVAPQAAIETAVADFESQLRILNSGSVLQRVAEREKLASDPTFIAPPGFIDRLRAYLPGGSGALPDRTLLAAAVLEKKVTIKRADRSFVVDVIVSDREPERAARLSRAVAEVYLENRLNNRRDLARRLGGEVTDRLQDLRERVEAAEKRLNDFKTANNLIFSGGGLVTEQDLTELNNQLNQARARTSRARARIDQLNRLAGNTGTAATAEVLDSPTIVQLRVRLAEASRQAAELRRNLGPLHPDIQAAEARVREANSSISAEVERRRSSIRNDYDQALASERLLARQIGDLKTKSGDVGQSMIALRELERAVEANKKVYEEFLLRSRELAEQQGIFANASYVLTPAVVPNAPSGLSLLLMIALGFFAGFPLGIALALLRSQFEAPVDDGQGHTAIFHDNHDDGSRGASRIMQPPARRANAPANLAAIGRADLETYIARSCLSRVVVPSDEISEFAQSIEDALPAGAPSVLLVVSATPSAPGAAVAAALAACWAYEGYDVLAVDADAAGARFSQLARTFGSPGLFDRLHRGVDEFVRWNGNGLPHLLGGLDPAQRREVNGARRIVAQRLQDIAASADNIILDAGCLSENSFAPALLRAATSAIIIVDQNGAAGRQASAMRSELEKAGVSVAGIVTVRGQPEPVHASPSTGFSFLRRKPKTEARSEPASVAMKR